LTGINLTEFWNQYLRTTMVPIVEYKTTDNELSFRYIYVIENFDMPVIAIVNGKKSWIFPTDEWKTKEFSKKIKSIKIKEDFYVEPLEVSN